MILHYNWSKSDVFQWLINILQVYFHLSILFRSRKVVYLKYTSCKYTLSTNEVFPGFSVAVPFSDNSLCYWCHLTGHRKCLLDLVDGLLWTIWANQKIMEKCFEWITIKLLELLNTIFENSLPKTNFGQNIKDSPNGSMTANSRSLQTATLKLSDIVKLNTCQLQ